MKDFATIFSDTFAQASPLAQTIILLVLLVGTIVMAVFWMRGRWNAHLIQKKLDQVLAGQDETQKKYTKARDRAERLAREAKSQLEDAVQKHTKEVALLIRERDDALARETAINGKLQQALPAFERVRLHNDALVQKMTEYDQRQKRLKQEVQALLKRFDDLQKIDADVWIQPSVDEAKPPEFVHRGKRKTRFVTFLNLKGGVGKTTLVANLAAAFATGVLGDKKRVLAVDLDYQGTLSNRCVEASMLNDRRHLRRTVDRLITEPGNADPDGVVRDLLAPMSGTEGRGMVLIADELLDHIDFRMQAIFAVESKEVRLHHRQFFHRPSVFGAFDYVFFDCPPRLTTSSINALAASDWIVVPTGLDPNDVEAVPRTLRWLEKLRTQAKIDFHASLAAVILNGTYRGGTYDKLTEDERKTYQQLATSLKHHHPMESPLLDHFIKDSNAIARAASRSVPFGTMTDGHELYGDVARDLHERIKN